MQIHRLFNIVYLLLQKKTLTAGELAARFEVSKRTILRDIDTLTIAGIPIYTTQGKGGGITILDNFVLNKTTLSADDQNQILMALQSLAFTEQIDAKHILSKLTTLFANTETNWIEIDFSRWGNSSPDQARFALLKQAILSKNAVQFDYPLPFQETQTRTIYPLKLLFKSKAWYVQAYCLFKQDYRTFKMMRMLNLQCLNDSFANQLFTPPNPEHSETITNSMVHLKLLFSADMAYRIYDEFDGSLVVKQDNGSFIVEFDCPEDYWLYGFLLSFGSNLQVLVPEHVKDNLLKELEKTQKVYCANKT